MTKPTLREILAELEHRGALPEAAPCPIAAELAEVEAEIRRREDRARRMAEVEADPKLAIVAALERIDEALAVVLRPRPPMVKRIERDEQGNMVRIIEEPA